MKDKEARGGRKRKDVDEEGEKEDGEQKGKLRKR